MNVYVGVGASAIFRCFEGFWFTSTRNTRLTVQCTASGDYSPDPSSLPNCDVVACPAPPAVSRKMFNSIHVIFKIFSFIKNRVII